MSQENVEIVQQASGTSSKRASLSGTRLIPTSRCMTTTSPMRAPIAATPVTSSGSWNAAWSGSSVEPERWIDAGDKVVVVFQMTAKGKGSGVEVKRRDAMVLTIRDGKQVRLDYYNSESQALEAAGLSE
jgi:ketosteroid isomerase-like protein